MTTSSSPVHEQQPARERFIQANGLSHHVVEWGDPSSSEVVLLCHGFLDLAWGFMQLGPRLAQAGYRAVALDFRGHGESGRVAPSGYYYFPDYLLDLHELLPQLVTTPFHLLGHSMGGTVSSWYASTAPAELRTLALLEGLGPNEEDPARAPVRLKNWLDHAAKARRAEPTKLLDLDAAFERLLARHSAVDPAFLRALAEKSTCPHPSGEGLTWRFDPLHRTFSPTPFNRAGFMHSLSQIKAQTLVLQGERGFRSKDDDERIAQIPRVRREVIEGAGHMLHWTHCDRVTALLLDHLQSG
ncbi:MAG: Alpha/beta hydrolase [Myxococcaceae bacterium]|nr:Alpha/beta hydrolase [Myxococcaceae bacterium]